MMFKHKSLALAAFAALSSATLAAQTADTARAVQLTPGCTNCAAWNVAQKPFRVYGNTYYVGTQGLSAILITSNEGHVLLDGALPESAPSIMANIRTLGFRVEDIKLIVNSHAHFDHAGGIAAIQRASGATVAASPPSAKVLGNGKSGPDDPQFAVALPYPAVARVQVIADGEVLRVGTLALTAHFTPGHTPGGTSWSWKSCESAQCLNMVYADSQTPVSAEGFLFTRNDTYPTALADFERGFALLERLDCDVLITPHPSASNFFERIAARDNSRTPALIDRDGCKRYAANARQQLAKRVATEKATH